MPEYPPEATNPAARPASPAAAQPLLTATGRYCTTIVRAAVLARSALAQLGLHRAHFVHVRSTRQDLDLLRELIAARKVEPVIDRILPLRQARAAHAFIETNRARGKVVIRLSE